MTETNVTNTIKCVVNHSDAIFPTKAHPSDIGYDLTAISVFKKVSDSVTLFDTGLCVCPPSGYYTEILPRSSISKTGYMLANSVGVIDPGFLGNLLIALIKVDKSAPDLELPFTRCQLVLRKAEVSEMIEVKSLDDTERGSGGFGSTDKEISKEDLLKKVSKSLSEIILESGDKEDGLEPEDDKTENPEWWIKMSNREKKEVLDKELR